MARILITSGPTRQYLDPVRYLTNASSGRMGAALAGAAVAAGHEVTVVSGPVRVAYPSAVRVVDVVTTEEMLEAAGREFATISGVSTRWRSSGWPVLAIFFGWTFTGR